jgi:hypothetical protein
MIFSHKVVKKSPFNYHSPQKNITFLILVILIFSGCIRDKSSITCSIPSYFLDYIFVEPEVTGNTFYIDPLNGSPEGDGSANNPWLPRKKH